MTPLRCGCPRPHSRTKQVKSGSLPDCRLPGRLFLPGSPARSGTSTGHCQQRSRTVSAAVTRPGYGWRISQCRGPIPLPLITGSLLSDHSAALDYGGLDLCPPMLLRGCSDAPVRPGSTRYPHRAADSSDRMKWQLPAHVGIAQHQVRAEELKKLRTLNPRVRGSSPWRRTRPELVVLSSCCLIIPPPERTCRRLSQAVASRETLRDRKVINTKSAHDNQDREPHKDRQQRR